jgi:hypothetical protein
LTPALQAIGEASALLEEQDHVAVAGSLRVSRQRYRACTAAGKGGGQKW